jgi:signal peptidase II
MIKNNTVRVVLLIIFSFDLLILESLIKYYFILNKIPSEGFYFFSGLLQIGKFTNTNIAFGLPLPQFITMILAGIIIILLGFLWWKSLLKKNIWQLLAVSMIIIGALSNLLDRLIYGYVIDYLNVFIWPVFNLADAMIVIGVVIYLIHEFRKKDNI